MTTKYKSELEVYEEPFRLVVLNHIKTAVDKDDWADYRARARNKRNSVLPASSVHYTTAEELVAHAVCEDAMTIKELTSAFIASSRVEEIGQVEGGAVYFIHGCGIYAWSLSIDHPFSLSLWLSFPAYPPGW